MIFKYPAESDIEKGREDVFEKFAFPFGVHATTTTALSQQFEGSAVSFVFAIKSEKSYLRNSLKEGR